MGVLIWLAPFGMGVGVCARPLPVPPMGDARELLERALEIEEGQSWEKSVAVPPMGPDESPVLHIRCRVPYGGGGGNFVFRISVNGSPLRESLFSPRLLNKLPLFDPPNTKHHFAWYRGATMGSSRDSWFTVFSKNPQGDWAGTGNDFDYVFDLGGLVHGSDIRLGIEHVQPGLSKAMKSSRAELLIERLALGAFKKEDISRLREAVRGGAGVRPGTVERQAPEGERAERAYEVIWSGRPAPPAQVTFEDLDGWRIQSLGDGATSLSSSRAKLLWHGSVGKLTIPRSDGAIGVAMAPPSPIPLGEGFDAANLWVYGHLHFMHTNAQPIGVSATVVDSRGTETAIDLGPIRMGYWMLLHGNVSEAQRENWVPPLYFKELHMTADRAKDDYTLYLDAIHFYDRKRQPRPHGRPESPGFPINDDGFLPTAPPGTAISVEKTADGARFISADANGRLAFDIRPVDGCLAGISGRWHESVVFEPCRGGGVLSSEGGPLAGSLVTNWLDGERFVARWKADDGREWQAAYGLKGRSLIVDISAVGGWATGTSFGGIAGLANARGIEIPYLKLTRHGTMTRMAAGNGIFVSVLPDLYHSDYSLVDAPSAIPGADRVVAFDKTIYRPLTDGRRNNLRDRVLITASADFADTLPNHRNPRSPNIERLAPHMFVMGRALELERWHTFKRYGLDHVIATDFAGIFVKGYSEGFGVRWRPHPDYTIEQVQAARKKIRGLGFLFGAYIDVTDWPPLNEFWDENQLALTPEGDLCEAWPGSYCPKWDYMWVLARLCGQKMKELYPPDCVYLDVTTNRGSEAMDYEAGYPGAGMARHMMIGVGDSLVETRRWYGSTVSEGIFRWMYAGLSDMDYAQVKMSGLPLPLDFDLLKIHPYQIGTMMGYGPTSFLSADEVKALHDGTLPQGPSFYRYVATSLAYGHSALLGYGYFPPMSACIAYYALMQGAQKIYLPDRVSRIEYHDGERFMGTSEALQKGIEGLGRVRVTWRSGLVVTVNLSNDKSWTVSQGGKEYLLPPNGWVLSLEPKGADGGVLGCSAMVDGKRMDYMATPDYYYLSGGERRRRMGPLEVEGAAWLKREGKGWRLIPCGRLGYWGTDHRLMKIPSDRGTPTLIVDAGALGLSAVEAAAVDEMGKRSSAMTEVLGDGRLRFKATAETRCFVIEPK